MSYERPVRSNSDQHVRAGETRHTEEGEGHLHDPPGGGLVVGPGALLPRKEAAGGKYSPAPLSFRAIMISPCVVFWFLFGCYLGFSIRQYLGFSFRQYLGFSLDCVSVSYFLYMLPSEVAPPEA